MTALRTRVRARLALPDGEAEVEAEVERLAVVAVWKLETREDVPAHVLDPEVVEELVNKAAEARDAMEEEAAERRTMKLGELLDLLGPYDPELEVVALVEGEVRPIEDVAPTGCEGLVIGIEVRGPPEALGEEVRR